MKQYRSCLIYSAVSFFVFLFGVIYTANGYGVTSLYMTWAFLPTALIALWLRYLTGKNKVLPREYSAMTLAFFAASLTVYFIVKGVFGIAGAYSDYDVMLLYTALLSGGAFLGFYISQCINNKQ